MRICVYPGSFDPFSEGHLDVLRNAVSLFDCVYVGVLNNSAKHATFTPKERVDMIKRVVSEAEFVNVKVESFDGLLVDYVKKSARPTSSAVCARSWILNMNSRSTR